MTRGTNGNQHVPLYENADFLQELVKNISDGLLAIDADSEILYANPAIEGILGYSQDALIGSSLLRVIPERLKPVHEEGVARYIETGQRNIDWDGVELPALHKDRHEVPVSVRLREHNFAGERIFTGIFTDITERKAHEERLQRQAEKLAERERVLREMHAIIADRERSFSEQLSALLEFGRDELETAYGSLSQIDGDEYIFEVVVADDDSIQAGDVVPVSATNCEIAAAREETLVYGDVARDAPQETDRVGYAEWGIACYIGTPVYVDDAVYGTFCFYGTEPRDGQFSDWEVTLVDLMGRWVSYELQRERTNAKLEAQNERLERFASIVSHDLRNPLSVAEGYIDLTEETGELAYLDQAQEALDRMNTLIDDLLMLAQSGEVIDEVEPSDLASISTEAWASVQSKEATLTVETDVTIRVDKTRLQQLLENVFRNAVEHGGDAVTVRVGELPDGFFIEDDGVGIPADDRSKVFESGYSTGGDGSGLGLTIVAEISEGHGWEVTATESSIGGIRFEFTGVSKVGCDL